jgi:hypothetical protein
MNNYILEAEIVEIESVQEDQAHAFALNKREIEVIQNILAELYAEVEPTRLPGYTDDQMFELNAGIDFAVIFSVKYSLKLLLMVDHLQQNYSMLCHAHMDWMG